MATRKQWELVEHWADTKCFAESCMLELRARVEALEAKLATPPSIIVPSISDEHLEKLKQPGRIEVLDPGDQIVAPPGGLVERLADVWSGGKPLHPAACRAAIRKVAEWLEYQQEVPIGRSTASADYFAAMLRSEANR